MVNKDEFKERVTAPLSQNYQVEFQPNCGITHRNKGTENIQLVRRSDKKKYSTYSCRIKETIQRVDH
jgi:hypothetical protein